jgi:hypothetical protein
MLPMQILIFIEIFTDNDIHSHGSATTPMVLSEAAVEDLENRIDKSVGSIDFHI